jgi:hypothetical protein
MQKALSQVIIPPRAQASRRCETQAPLSGRPLALLAFRSLDPFRALREPGRRRRDGERLSRSEQRTGYIPKQLLDTKSPIQVRIRLPPAASPCEPISPAGGAERQKKTSWPVRFELTEQTRTPCHTIIPSQEHPLPKKTVAHSMTSSAVARSNGGTVRPSALAVLRLMTSSNMVGRWTGRSAGLAPLRIFPA